MQVVSEWRTCICHHWILLQILFFYSPCTLIAYTELICSLQMMHIMMSLKLTFHFSTALLCQRATSYRAVAEEGAFFMYLIYLGCGFLAIWR